MSRINRIQRLGRLGYLVQAALKQLVKISKRNAQIYCFYRIFLFFQTWLIDSLTHWLMTQWLVRLINTLHSIWNTLKHWWTESDDEILPVFAQVLWTIFSLVSMGDHFRRYFRQLLMRLALRTWKKGCKILKIIPLKPEIDWFSIGFCLTLLLRNSER